MSRRLAGITLGVLLTVVSQSSLAQTIQYMRFPAGSVQGGTLNLPLTLQLPCYGRVQVTITPVPGVTFFHQTAAENSSPQNAPQFSWGADTDRFNVFANAGTIDYTITFTFLDGPPDASKLLLVVAGLANGTTATVTTSPITSPGTLLGEFHFPPPLPGGSSTTNQAGNVLSSANDGDPVNTGWALYRPQSAALTSVSVQMHQVGGDGLGWTLAYVCDPAQTPAMSLPALMLLGGVLALVALKSRC